MSKYAMLIIGSDTKKPLENDCSSLSEILNNLNAKPSDFSIHGAGVLVFDLSSQLIPFCKATSFAYSQGRAVNVLFLDSLLSFLTDYKIDD